MNYFLTPVNDQKIDGLCNFVLVILDPFIWTVSEYSLPYLVCLPLSKN